MGLLPLIKEGDGVVDKSMCDSNYRCWGNGECNQFLNNSTYCYDGGDCSNKNFTLALCNNATCCNGTGITMKNSLLCFEIFAILILLLYFLLSHSEKQLF